MVFLQHPRERRVAVGTARMAHLALPNSELHVGIDFSAHRQVQAHVLAPNVAVLFPGEGALTPAEARARGLETLIVLDGTWPLAKKLLRVNPFLKTLPRVGFTPSKPGNYRIRREPAEHCVSTIEAVVEVLGQLEGAPGAFTPMLKAFDVMVEHQIAFTHLQPVGDNRYLRHKGPPRSRIPPQLSGGYADLVLVYAEANSQAMGLEPLWKPELVHWVACRPASGERFEAVVKPRHPLGANTTSHLEMEVADFTGAEPLEAARERFRAFSRPGDVWCTWGGHVLSLLKTEAFSAPAVFDLRLAASRALRGRPGSLEALVAKFGGPFPRFARGRAGLRMAGMERVVETLRTLPPVNGAVPNPSS